METNFLGAGQRILLNRTLSSNAESLDVMHTKFDVVAQN